MLVFAAKGVTRTSEVEQTLELVTLWCMDLEGNNPQSGWMTNTCFHFNLRNSWDFTLSLCDLFQNSHYRQANSIDFDRVKCNLFS